jgi:putative spermidine/putrescine transport system permease protein
MRTSRALLGLFCGLICAYLLAPILVVVGASFNAGPFLTFPPRGLSLRWFAAFLNNQVFISGVVGVAAALYHVRFAARGKEAVRVAILLPLLLPEVLTAMALLFFFYAIGIGTRFGIGMIVGHVLITLPFVFLNVVTALHGFDANWDLAARSLGANPWASFWRITLPLIKPGVINGCLFAFIISFDTFGISYLLKDVGGTTLPLQLFDYLRFNFTPEAAAVSTMSIVMALIVVVATEKLVGLKIERF